MYSRSQAPNDSPNDRSGSLLGAIIPLSLAAYSVLAFGGCHNEKPSAQAPSATSAYRQGVSIEQFVGGLPRNAAVVVGYDRWNYCPGPDQRNNLTTPTIEVLRSELTLAQEQKNTARANSIKDALDLTVKLGEKGVNTYVTSLETSNPGNGFYTTDFTPTHIISSGVKFSEPEANKIVRAHEYVRQRTARPASPTQKDFSSGVRFFYLEEGRLEEITGGDGK